MARKSNKQIAVESAYVEVISRNKGLGLALKIEELLNVAYGDERILHKGLISHLEFSYTIWNHYVKDDDVNNYLILNGESYVSTQSVIDCIEKLLTVTIAKQEEDIVADESSNE